MTTFVLPIYKFSHSKTIVIPGIVYRITFTQEEAGILLKYFKDNNQLNNLITINYQLSSQQKNEITPTLSSEALQGMRNLKKVFNAKDNYDWLLLGLISRESTKNIVTVSRIIRVSEDSGTTVITFQALFRGETKSQNEKIFKNGEISESTIKLHTDTELTNINELFTRYTKKCLRIFEEINDFKRKYSFCVKAESNSNSLSQGYKFAMSLSPLSNVLYLQLSQSEFQSSLKKLKDLVNKFVKDSKKDRDPKNSDSLLRLFDITIAVLPINNLSKLRYLESIDLKIRTKSFFDQLDEFNNTFVLLREEIHYVEQFYLNSSDSIKSKLITHQLKSIKLSIENMKPKLSLKPLSQQDDQEENDLMRIQSFIHDLPFDFNEDGAKLVSKEFSRLKRMQPQHSEYQVLRNYFDIILEIPFGKYQNQQSLNIHLAEEQLNNDHFGLYHVKKRLLQYLSVLKLHERNKIIQLTKDQPNRDKNVLTGDSVPTLEKISDDKSLTKSKTPILLFTGPPGVGKTSLAKSIAKTLGRQFQRISLGGVRDESEIRGHRRTYVGSIPGVLVNALRKAGTMNPVILLDEIDKVCGGANGAGKVNGDPAAALLEVLDPEQNSTFTDHYIGFPIDLSKVLFLCTANDLSTISDPLKDRTEIIEIMGYSMEEKISIGKRFLLPKQIKLNGLPQNSILIEDKIWKLLVLNYIREPGVRNLERLISSICRGKVVEFLDNESGFEKNITEMDLIKFVGLPNVDLSKDLILHPKYSHRFGVVNGLSYNSNGSGSVLVFEIIKTSLLNNGSHFSGPQLELTGRLGETLTESIKIGIDFIKSLLSRGLISNIDNLEKLQQLSSSELHLHVPMGGVSKDGPSAGITITLAVLSVVLEKEVDSKIAMTGEITLRGKVLPIGGINEKLLGASLFGIKKVLVPKLNRKDIIESFFNDNDEKLIDFLKNGSISKEPEEKVLKKLGIEIVYVDTFWDVIQAVWGDEITINHANYVQTHL